MRILITRRGCPNCREWMKIITRINNRLPINKQVKIVDDFYWNDFRVQDNFIASKLETEGFQAYPFALIDNIVINPASAELLETSLINLFSEDFIV